jgi:hypothetical protein
MEVEITIQKFGVLIVLGGYFTKKEKTSEQEGKKKRGESAVAK